MRNRSILIAAAVCSALTAAPSSAATYVSTFTDLGIEGAGSGSYYFDGHSASQTFLTGLTSVTSLDLSVTGGSIGMYASESITFDFLLNGTTVGTTTYHPGDSATRSLSFDFGPILSGTTSYDLSAIVTDGVCMGCGAIQFSTANPFTLSDDNPLGAVPEPGTWAMMLLGFGFIGGAMRSAKRRQKLTVSYA